MRINYHTLSSKISDRQTFREYIHGASRYTQIFNTNLFKIKNSITTALRTAIKPLVSQVAFSNEKVLERIRILLHQKTKSEITFDDSSKSYVREVIKPKKKNIIKIYNTKLLESVRMILKPSETKISFTNSKILPTLLVLFRSKLENKVTFNNDFKFTVREVIKPKKKNIIKISNSKIRTFLSEIIKPKQSDVIFKNDNSNIVLREKINPDTTNITVENSDAPIKLRVLNKPNTPNIITLENSKVNVSASYLTRLKMMSGSLNDYYNQTIADTGKRKVD